MKHKKNTILFSIAFLSMLTFISCKSNENVSPAIKAKVPVESPEVKMLKTYYAGVAQVNVSKINYDQITDVFSVGNDSKITHANLLKNYKMSLTGRIE